MIPGLQVQARLLVEKGSLRSRSPRRGEIVVVNTPYSFNSALNLKSGQSSLPCFVVNLPFMNWIGLTNPSCDAWIKRVVAVGGDQVSINPRGEVSVNGQRLKEPYVTQYCPVNNRGMGPCNSLIATVPSDHVLVLGDNRINSTDGRIWGFLPEKEILGRALWRFGLLIVSAHLFPESTGHDTALQLTALPGLIGGFGGIITVPILDPELIRVEHEPASAANGQAFFGQVEHF